MTKKNKCKNNNCLAGTYCSLGDFGIFSESQTIEMPVNYKHTKSAALQEFERTTKFWFCCPLCGHKLNTNTPLLFNTHKSSTNMGTHYFAPIDPTIFPVEVKLLFIYDGEAEFEFKSGMKIVVSMNHNNFKDVVFLTKESYKIYIKPFKPKLSLTHKYFEIEKLELIKE